MKKNETKNLTDWTCDRNFSFLFFIKNYATEILKRLFLLKVTDGACTSNSWIMRFEHYWVKFAYEYVETFEKSHRCL